MYSAPDLIKVKINVSESFAAYGCPMEEYGMWNNTQPCEGTPEYSFEGDTYVSLGMGHQCYATDKAPM